MSKHLHKGYQLKIVDTGQPCNFFYIICTVSVNKNQKNFIQQVKFTFKEFTFEVLLTHTLGQARIIWVDKKGGLNKLTEMPV